MRMQLDLPASRVEKLDKLMKDTDLSTRKELFNNALSLFEWAVKEAKKGNVIASVNEKEDSYREIHMPALSAAAAHVESGSKQTQTAIKTAVMGEG